MGRKKEQGRGWTQIGTSSMLLIFTVLCLIVFTVLSLSSAKADWKLAEKNMKSVTQYYEADCKAEEMTKKVNEQLIKFAARSVVAGDQQAAFKDVLSKKLGSAYSKENNTVSYEIEVNQNQIIFVSIQIFPLNQIRENEKNYTILSWLVQNKIDYEIDESMPVWNGEEQKL